VNDGDLSGFDTAVIAVDGLVSADLGVLEIRTAFCSSTKSLTSGCWPSRSTDRGRWRCLKKIAANGCCQTPHQELFVLVAYRLSPVGAGPSGYDPGEWRLHREWFERTALAICTAAISGWPIHKFYRCRDRLLEHEKALFDQLTGRWRDLLNSRFDLLLYDLTSTYLEAEPPLPKATSDATATRAITARRSRRGDRECFFGGGADRRSTGSGTLRRDQGRNRDVHARSHRRGDRLADITRGSLHDRV
jgi:hypothetical protein